MNVRGVLNRGTIVAAGVVVLVAATLATAGLALGAGGAGGKALGRALAGPSPTPAAPRSAARKMTAGGSSEVFLPVVFNASGGQPRPTPSPSPTSGDTGAFWLPFSTTGGNNPVVPTYGVNVAIDPAGGSHATYSISAGTDNNQRPAYYSYCPAGCGSATSWTRVALSDNVQDVRLQLTAQGHPRLMIYTLALPNPSGNPQLDNLHQYQYAACDANCTSAASWTIATIATVQEIPALRTSYVHHYFALDSHNNPAFVYTDSSGNHRGSFYGSCAGNCTDPASWTDTQLSEAQSFGASSLAFSATGQPRLAFVQYSPAAIGYLQCDAGCTDPAGWAGPLLLTSYQGVAAISLQVDSSGNPRLAYYSGDYPGAPFTPDRLYYLGCDGGCAASGSNWWYQDLGFPGGHGGTVDLVLDAASQPHLSFDTLGSGPAYGWCTGACSSGGGTWHEQIVESANVLNQQYPVAPIYHCSVSTWTSGTRSSLALDARGNPRIGFEGQHGISGTDLDHPWQQCPTEVDIQLARYVAANAP